MRARVPNWSLEEVARRLRDESGAAAAREALRRGEERDRAVQELERVREVGKSYADALRECSTILGNPNGQTTRQCRDLVAGYDAACRERDHWKGRVESAEREREDHWADALVKAAAIFPSGMNSADARQWLLEEAHCLRHGYHNRLRPKPASQAAEATTPANPHWSGHDFLMERAADAVEAEQPTPPDWREAMAGALEAVGERRGNSDFRALARSLRGEEG